MAAPSSRTRPSATPTSRPWATSPRSPPVQASAGWAIRAPYPGTHRRPALGTGPSPGGEDPYIDQAVFKGVFAGDGPAGEARLMAAEQRPVALAAFADPSSAPAWKTI